MEREREEGGGGGGGGDDTHTHTSRQKETQTKIEIEINSARAWVDGSVTCKGSCVTLCICSYSSIIVIMQINGCTRLLRATTQTMLL